MKKFLSTFIIALLCFSVVYVGIWKVFIEDETMATSEEEVEGADLKVKNEILFLLMGVDSNDLTKSKGTRTDTMMLVKANFDDGDISILSIPRDTRVKVNGRKDKINHAHAYGGAKLSIESVSDFLDIDLNHYVKVDYKAVKEIVDAIGGVEIDVPVNMYYNDPTSDPPLSINIKKGLQVLDGDKSHDYLRYRSGYADGDLGRVSAQQVFMEELIKQSLSPRNILKLPKLAKTYFDYVDTNISFSTITKGITSANKMDLTNIETNTIPGEGKMIDGISYFVYEEEETKTMVREMFGDYLISD